ncbi:unnamed protein product [Microthlaspi erraticum]|uniref:Uncharacterized protein n=1 Tax=Microthlaspi erraticum TaxID=1685480 RepID=A0A6D2KT60_9BRAS|nr:unnamed protein product [Microthlaspi erraticum]
MHVWSFEIGLLEHSGAYGHEEHGGTWRMEAAQLDTQRKKGEAILKTSSTVHSTNRSSSSTRPAKLQLDRAGESKSNPKNVASPLTSFDPKPNPLVFKGSKPRKNHQALDYLCFSFF